MKRKIIKAIAKSKIGRSIIQKIVDLYMGQLISEIHSQGNHIPFMSALNGTNKKTIIDKIIDNL